MLRLRSRLVVISAALCGAVFAPAAAHPVELSTIDNEALRLFTQLSPTDGSSDGTWCGTPFIAPLAAYLDAQPVSAPLRALLSEVIPKSRPATLPLTLQSTHFTAFYTDNDAEPRNNA